MRLRVAAMFGTAVCAIGLAAPSTATLTQPSYEQYPRRNRNADRRPQDHDDRGATSASSAKPVMGVARIEGLSDVMLNEMIGIFGRASSKSRSPRRNGSRAILLGDTTVLNQERQTTGTR